jgi:hypothetical protein
LTAQHKRNLEKALIRVDEMKTGTIVHKVESDATFITVEDNADAANVDDPGHEEQVKKLRIKLKEKISKI